ncbi:hypothetical protein ACS0TY_008515 [Phlomoides rotata]
MVLNLEVGFKGNLVQKKKQPPSTKSCVFYPPPRLHQSIPAAAVVSTALSPARAALQRCLNC